jgi:transposase
VPTGAAGLVIKHHNRRVVHIVRRRYCPIAHAAHIKRGRAIRPQVRALYAVEKFAAENNFSSMERAKLRQTQAQPLLDEMKTWLTTTRMDVANGSALAKAMDYSLRRWAALSRYAQDAILPIDNNPIENAIRAIALGKKNWLFAGSERAGKRAAAIQSLLATAKRNSIEPQAWLKDVIEKLPSWPNSRIDELLPFAGYRFG